ncbi:MAG: hypothetical protein R3A12_06390 [Ignavibacteria bacterium]
MISGILIAWRLAKITEEEKVKIYYKGKLEADVPPYDLVLGGGAPVYKREIKEPAYFKDKRAFDLNSVKRT